MTFRIPLLLLTGLCALAMSCSLSHAEDFLPKTVLTIRQDKFCINGEITYAVTADERVKGLLLNSRMVQGIFDDENPETVELWKYPDTQVWTPDRNTEEFVAAMQTWRDHGLLALTINLQGGSPVGYGNNRGWINTAFDADGNLKDAYVKRLEKILREADRLGMVVILGLFYFGQDQHLKDESAILHAVDTTLARLHEWQYKNILVEINNECDVNQYDHDILKPERVHELILRVKDIERNGYRFYVGTSYAGGSIPRDNVLQTSDFVLIHGNGVNDPKRITAMVATVRSKLGERKIPILFNEDDHFDFDKEENNMDAAVRAGASWGYFDYRMTGEQAAGRTAPHFEDGFQSVPVDWTINSERKRAFFDHVRQWTQK